METHLPNIERKTLSLEVVEGQTGTMPLIAEAVEGVCTKTNSVITSLEF